MSAPATVHRSLLRPTAVQRDPRLAQKPVLWEPSAKQCELLLCLDFEVLYGGAAGGGKSDALLIDALCGDAIKNKNHRAVLFRKTFPDLKDLIDRSLELYKAVDPNATYNQQTHVWTFSSGAKVEFAYLQNDRDRFKYRGRAWNYIGFDELTLWATSKCYEYLFSRCRTTDKTLPCYVRATTNPDGPGQKWVMERFALDIEGGPTVQTMTVEFEVAANDDDGNIIPEYETRDIVRRFIPAKLSDNPHLIGSGYRERLLLMSPEEREALLKGRWVGNRIEGAIFFKEMQRVRQEGRITRVPVLPNVPVNVFWDIGWNDTTALWFHQYAALANRFSHAYERSGATVEDMAAYIQQWSVENQVTVACHYLPHDAENVSPQTGKSYVDLLRKALPGHRFVIVARTPAITIGLNQARNAFATAWFDKEECADGIAALDAYRWTWNEKQQVFSDTPVHDRFSNFADAFRQFGQGYEMAARTVRAPSTEGADPHARPKSRRRSGSWRST